MLSYRSRILKRLRLSDSIDGIKSATDQKITLSQSELQMKKDSKIKPVFHGGDFLQMLDWLGSEDLLSYGPQVVSTSILNVSDVLAQPIRKQTEKRKQVELEKLRESRRSQSNFDPAAVFADAERVKEQLIRLDSSRYPSDAIAFYRPFHFAKPSEWGIYFDIEQLFNYVNVLDRELSGQISSFDLESLHTVCFCEIFQHEYFHHISECAATTIEILLFAAGKSRSVYLDYWYERNRVDHPDTPLEEALANAYAYNSLSFHSRIKTGLRTTRIKIYQQALKEYWKQEPPGYRDAEKYIDGGYIRGAGDLIRQYLPDREVPNAIVDLAAREVLLNGNATYFAKPDIPVYICGSIENIEKFNLLVPAPVEAYASLTWLDDSSFVDAFFDKFRKK